MRSALIVWVIGLLARTVCSEFVHPFEQFCVEAISRDQSVEAVCAISPTTALRGLCTAEPLSKTQAGPS
jgi:hypothetical protein